AGAGGASPEGAGASGGSAFGRSGTTVVTVGATTGASAARCTTACWGAGWGVVATCGVVVGAAGAVVAGAAGRTGSPVLPALDGLCMPWEVWGVPGGSGRAPGRGASAAASAP